MNRKQGVEATVRKGKVGNKAILFIFLKNLSFETFKEFIMTFF